MHFVNLLIYSSKSYFFNPIREQKIILNGTEKQTINFYEKASGFNILEINNTSREGVYSQKAVLANEINLLNNCKIDFAGCTEFGKTLEEDLYIDGDYCLGAGVLDLGNHNMTITGNLIQGGGTIKVGTGTLTVNGDYRIKSRINDDFSSGSFEMKNDECSLIIKGSFELKSTISLKDKLLGGIMEVGGDFIQSSNGFEDFISSGNHIVKFSKEKSKHDVKLKYITNNFNILDISDTTINLLSDNTYVFKELRGETGIITGNKINLRDAKLPSVINGDAYLYGYALEKDLIVNGNLQIGSRDYDNENLNLNGNMLTVNGDLTTNRTNINFNKGEIICNGNCTIGSSSVLYQKNAEDKLTVKDNFTYSGYGSSDNMVDGTITIGGDCTIDSHYFNTIHNLSP